MSAEAGADRRRKRLGAWYTPTAVVARVVDAVVDDRWARGRRRRPIRVLDPACGDGRFLEAAGRRLDRSGVRHELVGVDVDGGAVDAARTRLPAASIIADDALAREWSDARFDLVIGNPPFLSQLAAETTRRGSSRHGGGPYADAAVEFLALAATLVDPAGGRLAFVLPHSVLAARDAGPVRRQIDARATMIWSWSSDELLFDARVRTCALAFEFGAPHEPTAGTRAAAPPWSSVITARRAIPDVPAADELVAAGTLGDRALLNANFRDEYYGMVAAVGDHDHGAPLLTSGSIDPGISLWGLRDVTFAKRRFRAPRIDVAALDARMRRWADRRLVPKVLVANQTSIVEAVCDPDGAVLPGVPVIGIYPRGASSPPRSAWEIAAVLTSPFASAWAWHRSAGTGLSSGTIRLGPTLLAELPWPAGDLGGAVAALRAGDVRVCGRAADRAWGIDDDADLFTWWEQALTRIESRRPALAASG